MPWSTNPPGVAQVTADGIVTTNAVGTATITATLGALSDGDAIQVNDGTLPIGGAPAIAVQNRLGEPDPLSRPVGVIDPLRRDRQLRRGRGAEFGYDLTELADRSTSVPFLAAVDNAADKGVVTTMMASSSPVQIIASYPGRMGSDNLMVTAGP